MPIGWDVRRHREEVDDIDEGGAVISTAEVGCDSQERVFCDDDDEDTAEAEVHDDTPEDGGTAQPEICKGQQAHDAKTGGKQHHDGQSAVLAVY